jgi:hypothetical protein
MPNRPDHIIRTKDVTGDASTLSREGSGREAGPDERDASQFLN